MRFGKQFFGVSATLIILWIGASPTVGQTPSDCPSITVTGPAGVTEPGDLMEFSGTVSGNVPANLTYRWILAEDGEIAQGQGTLRLSVRTPRKLVFNIFATLEVLGLPAGCPTTASENAPVAGQCLPILIDEFSRLPLAKQLIRLDNAVIELRNNPDGKLHLIEYFPPGASKRVVEERVAWLSAQLKRRKLLPEDFEIVTSESLDEYGRTKIYRVPTGLENPAP